MADKNWTEKLRQQMSEHSETPPEGLWESIEAAGAAGSAAKAGLLAAVRRFFSSLAPAHYALVGAAAVAAVAAVLLLRTPAHPGDDFVVEREQDGATAVDFSTRPSDLVEMTEAAPSDELATTETAPSDEVMTTENARSTALAMADDAKAVVPSDSQRDEQAVVTSEENGGEKDVVTSDERSDERTVISREERSGEQVVISSEERSDESRNLPDPFAEPEPVKPSPRKPLLAMSLGGGLTPGAATNSYTEYSMPRTGGGPGRSMVPVLGRNKEIETNISHRLNFQIGLLVSYSLSEQWALESGLQVTGLGSTKTSGTDNLTSSTWENLYYLGIPLHVLYTPWDFGRWSVYFSAGPAVEYGIYRKWSTQEGIGGSLESGTTGYDMPGDWVFSATLGAGVQWRPWRSGAFFLQPGVTARFVGENSPSSYYTERPFSFQLAAGYRILF